MEEVRQIPLYRSPAAAGYAAPVFGEDFDYVPVTGEVPRGAEFGVRIQGDSMEPVIRDGSVVYVNRDPLSNGDVGIFCVDGDNTLSARTRTSSCPGTAAGPWCALAGCSCPAARISRERRGCRSAPVSSFCCQTVTDFHLLFRVFGVIIKQAAKYCRRSKDVQL